ncbi:hypothetical protein, partial [Xanthomonas nasturtii]|uniref:hypothetical protein n=1 Tax=Xanthomonas nasturtii TaxID=1843581 RepID=UPI0032E47286
MSFVVTDGRCKDAAIAHGDGWLDRYKGGMFFRNLQLRNRVRFLGIPTFYSTNVICSRTASGSVRKRSSQRETGSIGQ